MIIEIPDDNSIVKWKYNDNDDWKIAEISDLIKAYENQIPLPRIYKCPKCLYLFNGRDNPDKCPKCGTEIKGE